MSSRQSRCAWGNLQAFAGFDWGRSSHQLTVLDSQGAQRLVLLFDHDAAGWDRARRELQQLVGEDLSVVGVAIETRAGPAVEKLLELGCTVFPMNPKSASRYRDRKAPSGTKDDQLDAWSFGDALRTDGHAWRAMDPEDPLTQQIRLLCRDEVGLTRQRTALVNALRQALHEYYPAALAAFDDWTAPSTWAFVQRFPTPQKLARAGKRGWDRFLHAKKLYRPQTYEGRIACFRRATALCGSQPVTEAKSLLALSLVEQLQAVAKHLAVYRQQIDRLFDQHPGQALFDSLPGAAEKLAPRLLGECADARGRFDDVEGLECHAGAAPIRFQSGQVSVTKIRRACSKPLRYAVHLWANGSRRTSAWADAYYRRKREEGKSHACALRCLGRRWLRILWKMLETGRTYDEAYHLHRQIARGGWVLQSNPEPRNASPKGC